jgi:glutathione S-transferase
MTIRLYGIPQSRTSRCLWMLEELGVPYENVEVSFAGDAQKPDYLKLNPNGRIPALDDDGSATASRSPTSTWTRCSGGCPCWAA